MVALSISPSPRATSLSCACRDRTAQSPIATLNSEYKNIVLLFRVVNGRKYLFSSKEIFKKGPGLFFLFARIGHLALGVSFKLEVERKFTKRPENTPWHGELSRPLIL